MRQLVLLGEAESKRTIYFSKACRKLGISLKQQTLDAFDGTPEPCLIKIDPPGSTNWDISQQAAELEAYHEQLKRLSQSGQAFYNEPEAIWTALDKRRCKEILQAQGLAVTEMWPEIVTQAAELDVYKRQINRLFRKRRFSPIHHTPPLICKKYAACRA